MFPHSVERTPHVGKEREGGRASNGTEGAAQRGGDLHRWLNSAPPDTHADSVEGHLHANVNTTIPQHIHAHMHLQLNEQTTLSITAALSRSLELQLLRIQQNLSSPLLFPPVHTQIFNFLSTHNYLSQISLAFQTNPQAHVRPLASVPRHRHEAACMWNSFTSPAVICFGPDSPQFSQDRRPCIELCRLKQTLIAS